MEFLHDLEAQKGADRLEKKMDEGVLMLDILPNSYKKYNGELEREDFVSFCTFLKSGNGIKVFELLDKQDEQEKELIW